MNENLASLPLHVCVRRVHTSVLIDPCLLLVSPIVHMHIYYIPFCIMVAYPWQECVVQLHVKALGP